MYNRNFDPCLEREPQEELRANELEGLRADAGVTSVLTYERQ